MRTSSPRRQQSDDAFTLVELLVVITIIVILVGLTVGVAGYANQKAARSRAESEVKALSAALESYKADNGAYPRDANTTDKLDARAQGDPSGTAAPTYASSTKFLYADLTGQEGIASPTYPPPSTGGAKVYFEFKPSMLGAVSIADKNAGKSFNVSAINDPYGYPYGYSTAYTADLNATPPVTSPTHGYNPTFDLWSTAGKTTTGASAVATVQPQWITNW